MKLKILLSNYLHFFDLQKVVDWFSLHQVGLTITRPRTSKLGDYRPRQNGMFPRISINHNLNPYEFAITLAHEMAHHECYEKYGKRVKPHGREWKIIYRDLFYLLYIPGSLPEDIKQSLDYFLHSNTSYRSGKSVLRRTLLKYEPVSDHKPVEKILAGNIFTYKDRTFRVLNRMRKRYKCVCLNNNRLYLFDPLVQVLPVAGQ